MTRLLTLCIALVTLAPAAVATSPAVGDSPHGFPGQVAPDFTATDITGATFSLAEHKGKPVVLEWTNPDCPFVKKHYDTGNMQTIQAKASEMGAVWVSINSSAPGKQGALTAQEAQAWVAGQGAAPTHYVLDPSGDLGRLYGAKVTPHIFVVDKDGVLAYAGAIDDNDSSAPESVEGAGNYALAALEDLSEGRAVETPETRAYGCSVKY
ncbi:MAG TPA: thioredoxin family protein [Rhodospirillaceae bacterium]|jgi:peroxiredoxin|nr:thioredoxin family protein [Alphaproteobacteria bacterium]HBH26575.1 thioredoxin family protein [Rhodospirillaceae bacterium]